MPLLDSPAGRRPLQGSLSAWCSSWSASPSLHVQAATAPVAAANLAHRLIMPVLAGMLAYAPRFSKYLHACACLHADQVASLPYWFLPNGDGSLSPASWDEMVDTLPSQVRPWHTLADEAASGSQPLGSSSDVSDLAVGVTGSCTVHDLAPAWCRASAWSALGSLPFRVCQQADCMQEAPPGGPLASAMAAQGSASVRGVTPLHAQRPALQAAQPRPDGTCGGPAGSQATHGHLGGAAAAQAQPGRQGPLGGPEPASTCQLIAAQQLDGSPPAGQALAPPRALLLSMQEPLRPQDGESVEGVALGGSPKQASAPPALHMGCLSCC